MSSIVDKIHETIQAEELKNSNDKSLKEFQQVIEEMKKLGVYKKPDYTLPLADTIGKGYYSSLNKTELENNAK